MRCVVMSILALIASIGTAFAQDVSAGEASFRKCQPCHGIGEGGRSMIGPQLNGLDGRKAGAVENANYSEALKNSGIVWGEQTFKDYVKNPAGKVPGTMMMISVSNDQEIADLWAYLKQFGPDGKKK
jgi:cytochrome c